MTYTDKIKHFLLCLFVTLIFGWEIGVTTGIVIELTQAEYNLSYPQKFNIFSLLFWQEAKLTVSVFLKRLCKLDTLLDLVADGLGVIVAVLIVGG